MHGREPRKSVKSVVKAERKGCFLQCVHDELGCFVAYVNTSCKVIDYGDNYLGVIGHFLLQYGAITS